MYYLILPITNIPAPPSQHYPVAPLYALTFRDEKGMFVGIVPSYSDPVSELEVFAVHMQKLMALINSLIKKEFCCGSILISDLFLVAMTFLLTPTRGLLSCRRTCNMILIFLSYNYFHFSLYWNIES